MTETTPRLGSGSGAGRTAPGAPRSAPVARVWQRAGWALVLLAATSGCAEMTVPDGNDDLSGLERNRTTPGAPEWQPFSKDSVWNLKLPAQRQEVALPAGGLMVGPLSTSDSDYGVRIYFARASDPAWAITYDDYNSATDNWSPPSPTLIRAPARLIPPTGSDGTVIIVDENRQYAYELWQFNAVSPVNSSADPSPQAHCASLNQVDLRSDGIHRNVGVTAAGLPGVGGLLRSLELSSGQPIRHKLWLAVHPELLLANAVWPANQSDSVGSGAYASVSYGDVVALSQSYDVANGQCNLSPLIQRVAQGLQDYGGIVQDRGGDSVGMVAEVGSVTGQLDIAQAGLWAELACLRSYLVRINNPWTDAEPGGLGY